MADPLFGFIGLGAMGEPIASNIAEKGHAMIVHDIAGPADRALEGPEIAQSNFEIVKLCSKYPSKLRALCCAVFATKA